MCCLNLTTDDNWKKPEKPTVVSSMVVGRAALVIKRNLLIRFQRRVEGLLIRPEQQGWRVLVRARAGSYMPTRETFEPARRMIPSKCYYSADGKVG